MRTTNEVIEAVQNRDSVSELELKCAVVALNVWKTSLYFDLARALTEAKRGEKLTGKTVRGLQRAWDNQFVNFNKDLETFILGSSYDPRNSKEENHEKFLSITSGVAEGLQKILGKPE